MKHFFSATLLAFITLTSAVRAEDEKLEVAGLTFKFAAPWASVQSTGMFRAGTLAATVEGVEKPIEAVFYSFPGPGGGGDDNAAAQAARGHRMARGTGVRGRLSGADLSHAVVGVHRPGVGPDLAIPGRSGVGTGVTGSGGPMRGEPARHPVAGCLAAAQCTVSLCPAKAAPSGRVGNCACRGDATRRRTWRYERLVLFRARSSSLRALRTAARLSRWSVLCYENRYKYV